MLIRLIKVEHFTILPLQQNAYLFLRQSPYFPIVYINAHACKLTNNIIYNLLCLNRIVWQSFDTFSSMWSYSADGKYAQKLSRFLLYLSLILSFSLFFYEATNTIRQFYIDKHFLSATSMIRKRKKSLMIFDIFKSILVLTTKISDIFVFFVMVEIFSRVVKDIKLQWIFAIKPKQDYWKIVRKNDNNWTVIGLT